MDRFSRISGIAAPLPRSQVDTDAILPARFLLLLDREAMAQCLFRDLRGDPQVPFVLDTPPWDEATIIVAGPDFGTGSSREHAVWALLGSGIRCVIAPSFGDIFHANAIKNGLLPVSLDAADHARAMRAAEQGATISVDLAQQTVAIPGQPGIAFAIAPRARTMLLDGMDEIDQVLADDLDDITAFELLQRDKAPWLHLSPEQLSIFPEQEPAQ